MESDNSLWTQPAESARTPQSFRMAYEEQRMPPAYNVPGEQPASLPNLILPEASTKLLNIDDIKDKPADEIGLGRNEIYARHGRSFVNPNYANYFQQQDWYNPNPNFRDSDLTALEQRNVLFLHMTELSYDLNGQRGAFQPESTVQANLPGSVIGDSSTRQLSEDEVANLSPQQLRQAQNDIYASHGYPFQTAAAKNYYSQFSWYQPNPNFSDKDLSWTEERNLELMRLTEMDRKLGAR